MILHLNTTTYVKTRTLKERYTHDMPVKAPLVVIPHLLEASTITTWEIEYRLLKLPTFQTEIKKKLRFIWGKYWLQFKPGTDDLLT